MLYINFHRVEKGRKGEQNQRIEMDASNRGIPLGTTQLQKKKRKTSKSFPSKCHYLGISKWVPFPRI